MDLLNQWRLWDPSEPPYLFDADRPHLSSARSLRSILLKTSWNDAHSAPDFGAPGDNRLHLGLLPVPLIGDLRRASVFLLLLNPGVGPHDYYAEYEVPEYRNALLRNLRQDFKDVSISFLFLDPKFSWHGGFDWWHTKFAKIIHELARHWEISYSRAREKFANQLAAIELLPYHSASFRDADRWIESLPSVALAQEYARKVLLPRARAGNAIVIVTRRAQDWGIPPGKGTVIYSASEARAAHLSPASRGGEAILDFVLDDVE